MLHQALPRLLGALVIKAQLALLGFVLQAGGAHDKFPGLVVALLVQDPLLLAAVHQDFSGGGVIPDGRACEKGESFQKERSPARLRRQEVKDTDLLPDVPGQAHIDVRQPRGLEKSLHVQRDKVQVRVVDRPADVRVPVDLLQGRLAEQDAAEPHGSAADEDGVVDHGRRLRFLAKSDTM